jgi:hypothetical protein
MRAAVLGASGFAGRGRTAFETIVALVEGLRNPTVAIDERIRDLVPFPLTSFEDAVATAT